MRARRPRRWHQRCFVWVVFCIVTTCVWRVIDVQGQFVTVTVQTKEEGASSYIPNASSVRRIGNKLWPSSPPSIRKWGCNRSETPFIFLHLGKAGGGSVRARIANRARRNSSNDPGIFPVKRHNETLLAAHCNSGYSNFEPRGLKISSYERTLPCNATTPIGQALACPDIGSTNEACPLDPTKKETAHVVYSGHNHLGVELHWLPVSFLEDWWQTHWGSSSYYPPPSDFIQETWKTLDGTRPWCGNFPRPTNLTQKWEGIPLLACARRMGYEIDEQAVQALSHHRNMASKLDRARAFSHVYSSLPVLRVVVLREPYSWILSKFFWSNLGVLYKCDDIQTATYGSLDPDVFLGADSTNKRLGNIGGSGWLRRISLGYILALCGYDCVVRLEGRLADLDEIATQAEYNLRNGIAVVGLLQELDSFYEMVTARVEYMDLASPIVGAKQDPKDFHQSGGGDEKQRCTRVYQDPQFQAQLKTACPEFAALVRLYEVGVQVNRFQKEELQQCATEDRF